MSKKLKRIHLGRCVWYFMNVPNVMVSTDGTDIKLKHSLFTADVQQEAEERRTDNLIEELPDRLQEERQKISTQQSQRQVDLLRRQFADDVRR